MCRRQSGARLEGSLFEDFCSGESLEEHMASRRKEPGKARKQTNQRPEREPSLGTGSVGLGTVGEEWGGGSRVLETR